MWVKDKGRRPKQVGEVIHRLLAELIAQGVASDRASLVVNIHEVIMSPDLRHAKVFYFALEDGWDENLNLAIPEIRKNIAKKIGLRLVPRIHFQRLKTLDLS